MNTVSTQFGTIVFDRAFVQRFYNFRHSSVDQMQRHIVASLQHKETRNITDIKSELLAQNNVRNGMVLLSPYGAVFVLTSLINGQLKLVWMEGDKLM